MGVISVRLNKEEEKRLKQLSDYFHEGQSALIKKSLGELYEHLLDLNAITQFEEREKKKKISFSAAEDILESS